jgi:hypothetical protein
MSTFELQVRIFFSRKILVAVVVLGGIAHFVVDGLVKDCAAGIRFPAGWEVAETRVRFLLERRGARAVWLWTLLPASIGWMLAGNAARRFERLAFGR